MVSFEDWTKSMKVLIPTWFRTRIWVAVKYWQLLVLMHSMAMFNWRNLELLGLQSIGEALSLNYWHNRTFLFQNGYRSANSKPVNQHTTMNNQSRLNDNLWYNNWHVSKSTCFCFDVCLQKSQLKVSSSKGSWWFPLFAALTLSS